LEDGEAISDDDEEEFFGEYLIEITEDLFFIPEFVDLVLRLFVFADEMDETIE